MVYCGKPSKGCSSCRERKIRCDQRERGCGQCEKRQQPCPGYRNMVDLMFRDESSHVIEKAEAKARKKRGGAPVDPGSSPEEASSATTTTTPPGKGAVVVAHDARDDPPAGARAGRPSAARDGEGSLLPSAEWGHWPVGPASSTLFSLAPSPQERGIAYFYSRYVTIDANVCHQRFDFVHDIWKPASLLPERQADGVLASMTAVGLMGLANMTHSRDAHEAARRSYGTALRLTNAALRDPAEAARDSTVLSVLVLGLFEMMTGASHRTLRAWQGHINGAAALARLRGAAQFRTRSGIRMFLMLCQNVMISCIQRELPMPPTLVALRNELAGLFATAEPSVEISRPIYTVLQLRYDIKRGHVTDPDVMVDKLNDVEAEFEAVIATFPGAWRYGVFRVPRPHPAVFRSVCHVYPGMWAAVVWNGLRTCRILILETILSELGKRLTSGTALDPAASRRYEAEYQKARTKLERLQLAIVASVPQHFGLLDPLSSYAESLTPVPPEAPEQADLAEEPPACVAPAGHDDPGSAADSEDGLTLLDPNRAGGPEEDAERYMLLASATNSIIWPLYQIGMSSVSSLALRKYAVERLYAIHGETGSAQAKTVAGIIVRRKPPGAQAPLPSRGPRGYDEGWPRSRSTGGYM